jgi:hypothetical protein
MKRVIELRMELLQNKLRKKCAKGVAAQIENELEFLDRVLKELTGTVTGDIIFDLTDGDEKDWLIQHPYHRTK